MTNTKQHLWQDFPELLKLETSLISFLYVVLGFCLTAISGHNSLIFELSNGEAPKQFLIYGPFFSDIVTFTIINIVWVALGLIGAFSHNLDITRARYLAWANGTTFVIALGYFAVTIYSLTNSFVFR